MKKYINVLKKRIADKSFINNVLIPADMKLISFTFDDAPKSAFTNAQKILDKYHLKATYYVALSFLDSISENENLYSREHLISCDSHGHELGCHTYGHVHFYQISDVHIIEKEILKNNEKLNEIGINKVLKNFSYPFGEQTKKAKKVVTKHFDSCRGIDHGINIDQIDINNLKTIRLYEKLHSLDKIFSILEKFSHTGGWLIFYTHDVETNYSKYGCSPEYFENVVSKCIELDIDVKTVKSVVEALEIVE